MGVTYTLLKNHCLLSNMNHLHIDFLPYEVLEEISTHLDLSTLTTFISTNSFTESLDNEGMWRRRIRDEYGILDSVTSEPRTSHLIPPTTNHRIIYEKLREGSLKVLDVVDYASERLLGRVVMDRDLGPSSIVAMLTGLGLEERGVVRAINDKYKDKTIYKFMFNRLVVGSLVPKTVELIQERYTNCFERVVAIAVAPDGHVPPHIKCKYESLDYCCFCNCCDISHYPITWSHSCSGCGFSWLSY